MEQEIKSEFEFELEQAMDYYVRCFQWAWLSLRVADKAKDDCGFSYDGNRSAPITDPDHMEAFSLDMDSVEADRELFDAEDKLHALVGEMGGYIEITYDEKFMRFDVTYPECPSMDMKSIVRHGVKMVIEPVRESFEDSD